jgi:MbtH protein
MPENPFDDPDAQFVVLVNEEGQYSLWPTFADLPGGWAVSHGPDQRDACLDHVRENWRDMRPRSLAARMDGEAAAARSATGAGPATATATGAGATGTGTGSATGTDSATATGTRR